VDGLEPSIRVYVRAGRTGPKLEGEEKGGRCKRHQQTWNPHTNVREYNRK
jgi:hypothetical protein